jgi:hypothetical protein
MSKREVVNTISLLPSNTSLLKKWFEKGVKKEY